MERNRRTPRAPARDDEEIRLADRQHKSWPHWKSVMNTWTDSATRKREMAAKKGQIEEALLKWVEDTAWPAIQEEVVQWESKYPEEDVVNWMNLTKEGRADAQRRWETEKSGKGGNVSNVVSSPAPYSSYRVRFRLRILQTRPLVFITDNETAPVMLCA